MSDKKLKQYTGEGIDVQFESSKCIHAAECVRNLSAVFDPKRKPWVLPDEAAADAVAEVVRRCPSGALTFDRKDGGGAEARPDANVITIQADGPLYLRGNVELTGSDGVTRPTGYRVALCRCGKSANKPFCDNSHRRESFSDPAALPADRLAEADPSPGAATLRVTVQPGGPLHVQGGVGVVPSGGEARFSNQDLFLCRCGASSSKPFCDGSHKAVDLGD